MEEQSGFLFFLSLGVEVIEWRVDMEGLGNEWDWGA